MDGVQGTELINRGGWARETDCKANSWNTSAWLVRLFVPEEVLSDAERPRASRPLPSVSGGRLADQCLACIALELPKVTSQSILNLSTFIAKTTRENPEGSRRSDRREACRGRRRGPGQPACRRRRRAEAASSALRNATVGLAAHGVRAVPALASPPDRSLS